MRQQTLEALLTTAGVPVLVLPPNYVGDGGRAARRLGRLPRGHPRGSCRAALPPGGPGCPVRRRGAGRRGSGRRGPHAAAPWRAGRAGAGGRLDGDAGAVLLARAATRRYRAAGDGRLRARATRAGLWRSDARRLEEGHASCCSGADTACGSIALAGDGAIEFFAHVLRASYSPRTRRRSSNSALSISPRAKRSLRISIGAFPSGVGACPTPCRP